MSHYDSSDLLSGSNVRVFVDEAGRQWTCWGGEDESEALGARGCEPTESVVYDRDFGG